MHGQANRVPKRTGPRRLPAVLVAALLALGAACTALDPRPLTRDADGCHTWLGELDAAIAAAGVDDAESERVPGFPGLRVDRVAQGMRERLTADLGSREAWLAHAAALDAAARAAEIANLPDAVFPLGPAADRTAVAARTDACRDTTLHQLADAGRVGHADALLATLAARAVVPDRYSTASRTLGLYPLLRWPFLGGVRVWQTAHQAETERWARSPPPRLRHGPGAAPGTGPPPWPPVQDALGLPRPTAEAAKRLLDWHAPFFEIEQRAAFDRIGAPGWSGAGPQPAVDTAAPVVYARIAHTRLQGRWRLQLVYTLWFPQRPPKSGLDLLAGTLDGLIVRLTLGDDGRPLMMDTIHACGCSHLFFPSAALSPRPGAPSDEEWMYSPAALPAVADTQRLVVRIASATHEVHGITAGSRALVADAMYALRDDQALRSLPTPGAAAPRRSLYGPDGLVSGSERKERVLFWPMGVASAGAMRQWGHHATAFVGRRHFDDVDLLEQRFSLVARPTEP